MIPVFIEATLRSLLVGMAVAAGLRIFRVRNVLVQKSVWGLVLVSALAMPLLLPLAAKWQVMPRGVSVAVPAHPMTLLQELQERILAKSGTASKVAPPRAAVPQSGPPEIREPGTPEQATAPRAAESPSGSEGMSVSAHPEAVFHGESSPYRTGAVQQERSSLQARTITASPMVLVLALYCAISGLLLSRLAVGVFTTIRLWGTATPVPASQLPRSAASLHLRSSGKVASPITIGSAILLPRDYTTWDPEKLRIVLAHERSHIRQGDFYLQLLSGIYAALAWFSPLGWWLKHELAELAEAISDRAGMEEAASRASYAKILLEFAAAPRQISLGVAMARPGSLSRRIERLLNDKSFRQSFANGRRAVVAVALVPLALFASTMLVRVQAAVDKQPVSPVRVAASALPVTPAALAAPKSETEETETALESVESDREFPLPSAAPAVLAFHPEPQTPAEDPAPEMIATALPAPLVHATPLVMLAPRAAQEARQLSFDRTLSVSGAAQLEVSTGSGNIHVTRGAGSQIQIHGRIHVNHEGSEEQARQIAANPPIEQSGDTIRVGKHQEHWRGISIDYQIEAPAGTLLAANSGSGDIVDEGVGQNAKLQTGSGDISASGLQGPFSVMTGSGNITAEQTGEGDVVAQTGSGNIELKEIHGGFRGQTGSGDIKASGTPSASWHLQTGSGSIELQTGNAPITLDASTGSGSVNTEHEMMVQGSLDRHHIKGTLNGGGPTVRLETGSGDIQIH
jgi:beta-lactamase regulating signal transducer with metallopeptidase domain